MLDGLRDLSNEVAYLRGNFQQIIDLLDDLDSAGKDQADLSSFQHDLIRSYNRRYAAAIRVHLGITAEHVSDWARNVKCCMQDSIGHGV